LRYDERKREFTLKSSLESDIGAHSIYFRFTMKDYPELTCVTGPVEFKIKSGEKEFELTVPDF
jgi:hypothetical protein